MELLKWIGKPSSPSESADNMASGTDTSHVLATSSRLDSSVKVSDTIGNRFVLFKCINEGSFSSVWEAHDRYLDNLIAVKFKEMPTDEELEMLHNEVVALRELPKDRFISVFDYFRDEERWIAGFTMELLSEPWETLNTYIFHYDSLKFNHHILLSPATHVRRCLNMTMELLDSAEILHALGYIHRDIKPDNIYININKAKDLCANEWHQNGYLPMLKIGDLGLVTKREVIWENENGTTDWMAPEPWQKLDHRYDLFAIGKLLYLLITGIMLDEGHCGAQKKIEPVIREVVASPQLSRRISAVVAKLTKKYPTRRYSHAKNARADIANILEGN